MVAVVKLVRRRDFGSDISSVSLFNYENGFSLTRDGWIQATAAGGVRVPEAMTLHVEGSSPDDLASILQLLSDKVREVGWYADGVERYGVWLRAQMPDESGARQALVTGMRYEPIVSFYAPPAAPGNFMQEGCSLAIERTPWWESIIHNTAIVPLNCTGGLADYSYPITVAGTIPARIAKTSFLGVSGSGPLYEFWLGFRSDRFGNRANLATVWDLGADGAGSNDTTTDVADATAHDDYRARCTFGTATELKRIQIALQSATTDYADQRGSFIVLLRAKVDAGTTCHVRLKDGFLYTAAIRAQQRVKITSTDWFLHALGTVDIPPSHGLLAADFLRQYGFEIHASRTSDSGYLDMDCLILIPRTEGSLHVTGAAVTYFLGDLRPATIMMTADGKVDGWWYQSNLPRATLAVEPDKYALPVGDGAVVIAGQRETEHDLDDGVNLSLSFYRRWRTLRGSE